MPHHHESLQNGFPGPRIAGAAMIIAPLLLLAAALAVMRFEGADFETVQARIAAEPLRAEIGLNLFILGWSITTLAAFAVARLVSARRPALGAAGGLLVLGSLTVSLVFSGIVAFEHAVAEYPDRAAAVAVNSLVTPPLAIAVLLPAVPLGWATLAVGAWRAGVLGPARAAALAGPALLPVGAIVGVPAVLPVGFALFAVALVPLGVSILRAPRAAAASGRTASSAE